MDNKAKILCSFIGFLVFALGITSITVAQDLDLTDDSEQSIDINALVEQIAVDTQKDAFAGYSYKLQFVKRKSASPGSKKLIKKYEVILPSVMPPNRIYSHPLLLTYDTSQRLTPLKVHNERKRILKELTRLESGNYKYAFEQNSNRHLGGYVTLGADENTVGKQSLKMDLVALLNHSVFSNPKEIMYNGRETISLDFKPAEFPVKDKRLFYLDLIEGILLIDKKDNRIASVEGFPLGHSIELNEISPDDRAAKRVFTYIQTRVKDGFWFPQKVSLNFLEAPETYRDLKVAIEYSFSEYRRFYVEIESAEVEPLKDLQDEDVKDSESKSKELDKSSKEIPTTKQ